MIQTELEKRKSRLKRRAEEIKQIDTKEDRYNALVEFIKEDYSDKYRWSIAAIADVANEYVEKEHLLKFIEKNKEFDYCIESIKGGMYALEDLLIRNGWGYIIGLE